MVFLAVKPSRLAASCCNFEVMKGGGALRRRSLRVTSATVNFAPRSSSTSGQAASPFGSSAFSPSSLINLLRNCGGSAALRSASMLQYSTGTNFEISSSRSTTSRTATDCTRPAESPRRTFFQRMGEIWYPTRRSSTRRACCAS